MSPTLRERIDAFLQSHHVMSLATVGPDGPWSAAVFYAGDATALYFLSAPGTRHGRDLDAGRRAAATIQHDVSDWAAIRGLQLEGTVTCLAEPERSAAQRCYGGKFPRVADPQLAPPQIAAALQRVQWYRLAPRRIRLIDNALGFGHREELDLPA